MFGARRGKRAGDSGAKDYEAKCEADVAPHSVQERHAVQLVPLVDGTAMQQHVLKLAMAERPLTEVALTLIMMTAAVAAGTAARCLALVIDLMRPCPPVQ